MKKQHPKLKVLNRMLIYSEEGKGIINDARHVQYSEIGRPRSVPTCTSENIDAVIGLLPTSVRRVQHELNGTVRKSTTHRVLILFKRYFLHVKCDAAFERARLEFAS